MTENIFCQACQEAGSLSKMSAYQLNMEEAILMCDNSECVFALALGTARLRDYIMTRRAEDIFKLKSKGSKVNQKIQLTGQSCKVIHWENVDALCWLNSALSLLVHNNTIKHLISRVQTSEDSLLKRLVDDYAKAQYLSEVDLINAKKVLKDVRGLVWTYLCPKMKCALGINDSPLFALLLLLKENSITAGRCIQEYACEFKCKSCKHTEFTRHSKHVVTFPNTPANFTLEKASFQRTCNKCNAKNQFSYLTHTRVPDVLFFHFVEGLNSKDYLDSRFNHEGYCYHLTQFIQYTQDPDHFICWTKHHDGLRWLDLDDLKPPWHCWSDSPPKVPPSQVHIIALQRMSSTCNNSSVDQNLNTSQSKNSAVSADDTSVHKVNNNSKQGIETELETKLTISSDYCKTSKKRFLECKSNRFPFKDLNTRIGTPQVCPLVINSDYEGPTSHYSTVNSSRLLQHKVKLKRLSGRCQFQPLIPKNKKITFDDFQPYVPKKERTCLPETSGAILQGKNCETVLSPHSPTSLLHSPSDSGYSSPSSVSSCASSMTSGKEENIADQLEKLLPDCLENPAPIRDISTYQDDIIQHLLTND